MKHSLLILLCFLSFGINAQPAAKLIGTWEGKINVGVELRIVFHFKDSLGIITGTTDSPDQGIKGVHCANITVKDDSLLLDVPDFKGRFVGKFQNDTVINGKLVQSVAIDLKLVKVSGVSALKRPQTPRPPFPYISEEVEYDNAGNTGRYGATITIPKGTGRFPAVLLITGSGAQNRDEEVFEHKPFAVIADHLTRMGYVVMRVDDRGVGKSSGDFAKATTADFADDVRTSLEYLKKRKEVEVKKIGLLGHSEGGMIAQMLASERDDIHFIILLAAPGEKVSKLMADQNKAILLSSGFTKDAAQSYADLYLNIVPAILSAKNTEEAKTNLNAVIEAWKKITPKGTVLGTTGIRDDSTQQRFVNALASSLATPWYNYFLQFDPRTYLEKVRCKVLALNGDKDLQVLSASNLAGIQSALERHKQPANLIKELPGLNHLFQRCKKCTLNEYGQLEETFSPEVLELIADWLKKNIK